MLDQDLHQPQLRWWSVAWRLIVSPTVPILMLGLYLGIQGGTVSDLIVAPVSPLSAGPLPVFAALIAGLPLYALYRKLGWQRWWLYCGGAALVAAAVAALFFLQPPGQGSWASYSSAKGKCDAIIDGIRTACGWRDALGVVGVFAGYGTASGLVFWGLLRWRQRTRPSPAQ